MARTSLDELELSGNVSNLNRAKKRDKNATPLTEEQKTEVATLDALIAQAMKTCKRGHTFAGRKNPAFGHLSTLVKTRELLLRGKRPPTGTEEAMADIEKLLSQPEEKLN
jgi:hypothetical protein